MWNLKKWEWLILIGLLLLSLVPCIGGIVRLVELSSAEMFPALPHNPRVHLVPLPAVLHIISSTVFCLLGAFQFLPTLRRLSKKRHRCLGGILVFAAIASAVTGLWMTVYYTFPKTLQGSLLFYVRLLIGSAMIFFVFLSVKAAVKSNVELHSRWIIRSYALGQGAGMQALVAIPWLLVGEDPIGLTRDVLMSVAWVINLAVAEFAIVKSRR